MAPKKKPPPLKNDRRQQDIHAFFGGSARPSYTNATFYLPSKQPGRVQITEDDEEVKVTFAFGKDEAKSTDIGTALFGHLNEIGKQENKRFFRVLRQTFANETITPLATSAHLPPPATAVAVDGGEQREDSRKRAKRNVLASDEESDSDSDRIVSKRKKRTRVLESDEDEATTGVMPEVLSQVDTPQDVGIGLDSLAIASQRSQLIMNVDATPSQRSPATDGGDYPSTSTTNEDDIACILLRHRQKLKQQQMAAAKERRASIVKKVIDVVVNRTLPPLGL